MIDIFVVFLSLFEFINTEACAFNLTIPGKCVCLENCDYAIKFLKKGGKPQTCYFEDNYPIVCCPQQFDEIEVANDVNIAKTKCVEIKKLYEYRLRGYILGGHRAKSEEYVHMAILGYGDESNDIKWLCGGSLISDRFVLTAAHCLNSREYASLKWVRLGELDLNNSSENADPIDYKVKSLIKHPDYKPPLKYNDIALVELENKVNFTKYIKPACIHSEYAIKSKNIYATGWGLINFNGMKSDYLQEVKLQLYSEEDCKSAYEVKRGLKDGIVDTHLCAGSGGGSRKDTCTGDSGGPLQYYEMETNGYRGYTIIGITSFGKICGITDSPGVYTRVSAYVTWIESIVWPN